ncbi:solute carrier family 22 member 6-A-like isoform X2 [Narcine bancroftii]|uniref:solute carrier family 22 member 6-A-like isoform X2 n=1 Tax=Narcine bancroftii TaxID=1343680 RepID=UPI0038310577
MGFADLLETVGGFGKFQVIHVVLLTVPSLFMASHNLLQNFVAAVPDHRCRVRLDANTSGYLNATGEEPLGRDLLRAFVPLDQDGRPDKCRMYTAPQWQLLAANGTWGNWSDQPDTQPCADGWVYDRSQFTATIVTEWDLVCGQKSLKRMAQSIYMAGLLIGAIVLGSLSDKYGRRNLLLWSSFQLAVSGICGMFSPSFPLFCFGRFLCGMALSGVLGNTYFYVLELIPTRTRTSVITCMNYVYTFGQLLLAGVAFCVRDWHWLQCAVTLPFLLVFLYSWWLSESARWLIMNDKADAALKELKKVARLNGKEAEGEALTIEILRLKMEEDLSNVRESYSLLDLFRTPEIRRLTFSSTFVWFALGFSYYGLSIDLQGFGANIYLIQVIFGAVDIPAQFITFLLLNYMGRCFTQSSSFILAGIIILINIFIPKEMQTLHTALAAVGKGSLAAAYACAYLHTAEFFPTVIRQTALGMTSLASRVGAFMAPIIRLIGDYVPFLPTATYGGIAVLAGIVAISLLETRNIPLPDTIEELERRFKCAKQLKKAKREDIPLHDTEISLLKQSA